MKNFITLWVEKYLFTPSIFDKIISFILLPLSFLYCLIVILKRKFSKEIDFNIKIISVGNITVGGSGKTPFCIAIAKELKNPFIILRGYGRTSKGLIIVSEKGKILVDVKSSGDEAMLLAKSLNNASVIVSEDRIKAILKAKEMGASEIILDDGFSKHSIKKLNILLKPNYDLPNSFCLPSGAYREPISSYNLADIGAVEDIDYKRSVKIINKSSKMLLITAISNPKRLDKFLPKEVIAKIYYPDHSYFDENELKRLFSKHSATSILVTEKDLVKMQKFDLPISILKLELKISDKIKNLTSN